MGITFGSTTDASPWLDNWPIYWQLWDFPFPGGFPEPGREFDLTGRSLSVEIRNELGEVAIAASAPNLVSVTHEKRGIVRMVLSRDHWGVLRRDESYVAAFFVDGDIVASFPFDQGEPKPGYRLLSGQELFAAPREILELIGEIPGAMCETFIELSEDWEQDERGYWVKPVPQGIKLYGLFVEDVHAVKVQYADLALERDRCWALVRSEAGDTIYYKGPEDLEYAYIETCFSRYVLRCLEEANKEIKQKSGREFMQRLVYRETHRALRGQRQLALRLNPVEVDPHFRIDQYTRSHTLLRRHTEKEVGGGAGLHVDGDTGLVTVLEQFWDTPFEQPMIWGSTSFISGDAAIEATYVGGFDKAPTDLAEACASLAAVRLMRYWNQAITQGSPSASIGCIQFNFGEGFDKYAPKWTQEAQTIIDFYQRLEIEAI